MLAGVDRSTMRQLVLDARVGHLATVGADGLPHLVPVCYALLGEMIYTAVDHKRKRGPRLRRIANIEATGRACLLIDAYDEDWARLWWVRLDGRARVEAPAAARAGLDALVSKYEQYAARPPAGPVIVVEVDQWSGWSGSR
jgi:PPOX class probable F420-dependent enzyme